MDVFDSNVWIYGLTRTCDDAVALLDEVVNTSYHVGVNAYIFDEVMLNLQRSNQSQEVIDRLQTRFADIVYGTRTIHGPTQDEIRQMDIEAERRDPTVRAMGEAFGVQNKDVPVVVYAHQCTRRHDASTTVIYTADQEFARFDPGEHFENLAMRYVDCAR